jgi:hypothetical protein
LRHWGAAHRLIERYERQVVERTALPGIKFRAYSPGFLLIT